MSKGYRTITVDDITYEYKIGSNNVDIRAPEGTRKSPTLAEVTGLSWDVIERDTWKKNFSVTPRMIADYITKAECDGS